VDDVLKVSNAACQTIDPGDQKGDSRLEQVEQDLEFGSAAASGAARLLSTDHVAAGGLQRATLQAEVLGRSSRRGHSRRSALRCRQSRKILDVLRVSCQNALNNPIGAEFRLIASPR
jgi:hypothetical protein